ncbi:citrate synthase [Angustibacter aerolatus]
MTSLEVADLLGVRLETVYAYASRGLLHSERAPGRRGSTFDRAEVEALRGGARRPSSHGSWRGPVIDTDVTLVHEGRPYLRGVDLIELSRVTRLEPLAGWLWTGRPGGHFEPEPEPLATARAAVAALGDVSTADALRVAVAAAAAADPLRYDVQAAAVVRTAGSLIATMVEALPLRGGSRVPEHSPLGRRLWARLTDARVDTQLLACLDAALVLLVDHDLAVSTVAARTAASTRANVHAVVLAALATMEGPLHGGAGTLATQALRQAVEGGARDVVAAHLRAGRPVPGLGHRLYRDGDPRGPELLERLDRTRRGRVAAADDFALADAAGQEPNVDLGLAALGVAAGMPDDAAEVVFSVARTVGWVAHALEEYDETPLRFRGSGSYRGPRPPQPVPADLR